MSTVLEAALLAGLASVGLIAGFAIANVLHPADRWIGLTMAFGAGMLVAVVAYSLVLETIEESGRPGLVGASIAVGALVYFFADEAISALVGGDASGGSGLELALGAVLDNVPESIVIGISAALTGVVSIPLVIGAFIANVGESIGATPDLEEHQFSVGRTGLLWLGIVAASVVSAIVGHAVLAEISSSGGAVFNGFAGGAVLMVLANALIPEGYEKAGRLAGLAVVFGFGVGFTLEHLV